MFPTYVYVHVTDQGEFDIYNDFIDAKNGEAVAVYKLESIKRARHAVVLEESNAKEKITC